METLQKVQMDVGTSRFCAEIGGVGAREARLCLSRLFSNSSHTGVIT